MRRVLALASLAPLAAAPAATAQDVPGWGEAARACLDGDRRAYVVFQDVLAGGAGRLGIQRADGSIVICDYRFGRVSRRPGDPAYPPRARSGEPSFFLDRPCAAAREARDEQGRAIGWFADPACRR